MDYKEEINKAADKYSKQDSGKNFRDLWIGFTDGALSQAAKDYWYNEFKADKLNELKELLSSITSNKLKAFPMSKLEEITCTEYQQYLRDNPDRPISFNNWKYMVEHYPNYGTQKANEIIECIEEFSKTYTMNDDGELVKKELKHIGIIGHVDHGKTLMVGLGLHESQKGVIIMDMDTPLTSEERFDVMKNLKPDLSAIKSIVPIADVMPIQPLSDPWGFERKALEDKPWDIKKQKKENHKRNNKSK